MNAVEAPAVVRHFRQVRAWKEAAANRGDALGGASEVDASVATHMNALYGAERPPSSVELPLAELDHLCPERGRSGVLRFPRSYRALTE